jgi:uncharacterized protein (DUF2225 family)
VTTLATIALTCPACDTPFTSQRLEVGGTMGRKATDFRPPADSVLSVTYAVHLCEHCGFAGPEAWFVAGAVSFDVRRHVWDELTPLVAHHAHPASEKYEFAARVATWDGGPLRQIADLWLRAAWCCVDEGDAEAERFYRRHAAWTFEEALETYGAVDAMDRAVITYLVGELWRRIGDTTRANAWFARVASEVIDPTQQRWIVECARQQRVAPRESFA